MALDEYFDAGDIIAQRSTQIQRHLGAFFVFNISTFNHCGFRAEIGRVQHAVRNERRNAFSPRISYLLRVG